MNVRRGAKMGRSSREKRDEMGKDVWSRGVVQLIANSLANLGNLVVPAPNFGGAFHHLSQ